MSTELFLDVSMPEWNTEWNVCVCPAAAGTVLSLIIIKLKYGTNKNVYRRKFKLRRTCTTLS